MSDAFSTLKNAVICKHLAADTQAVPIFVHSFFLKTFLEVKLYGS